MILRTNLRYLICINTHVNYMQQQKKAWEHLVNIPICSAHKLHYQTNKILNATTIATHRRCNNSTNHYFAFASGW